jgi:pimeloyl-ACP methyl ester carboxylesterase
LRNPTTHAVDVNCFTSRGRVSSPVIKVHTCGLRVNTQSGRPESPLSTGPVVRRTILERPYPVWIGLPALERRRARRYSAIGAEHLIPRFVAQARAARYAEALASMFANRTLGDQRERYRRLHSGEREIVVVAGAADRVVPLHDVARVRVLLPRHRYLEIPDADHNLLLTHPEFVAAVSRAVVRRVAGFARCRRDQERPFGRAL